MKKLDKIKTSHLLVLTVLLYFFVLIVNDGFMALDEYFVGITRYIPAQQSSVMTLVGTDDVKSPLQLMPMHVVAQAALKLGVTAPYWQYRAVIFVLGLLNLALLLVALLRFAEITKLDTYAKNFLILIFTFYFAAPFGLTRPMFESLGAPWLTLAAVWALSYDFYGRLKDLLWGVFFVSVAFVMRQQLGLCALVFMILPILKKQWKHLAYAAALGLAFFVISGIPDIFIRGKFHFSLLNVTLYNVQHGSDYGNRSILFYPVLIFVVAFVPWLIKRWPKEFLKGHLSKYRSIWMVLGLFVFLHSLFPQKWERFIISVIPILMFLVFPFLLELQKNFKNHKARLISLYAFNGLLFFIASFFPAQKNLIEMSRYLDKHPEIEKIYRINEVPNWITEAFITEKRFEFIDGDNLDLTQIDWTGCRNALVLGTGDLVTYNDLIADLELKAQFNVNLIEQLAYKLNPKNNARRVQLNLFCK